VRELVIVVSDLYLSPESAGRPLPAGVALPGLQHITRFASRLSIEGGWRAWLVRWLVASRLIAKLHERTAAAGTVTAATVAALAARASGPNAALGPMVWMATPVQLIAGMSSVHLDVRGVLRLGAADQAALAEEFRRIFHDSGFALEQLDSGDFLLFGPALRVGDGVEPARFLGESVTEVRKDNASDPALRRLSAEIEMWLHEHPVNEARSRRGEAPVTALWLWGGGAAPTATMQSDAGGQDTAGGAAVDIAFGRDAYLQGLWASVGEKVHPLPQQLADVFSYPDAQRAVLVIEIGSMLHSVPTWTFIDALAQIDRAFLTPAVEALGSGKLERIVLVANDRELTLGRHDHLKLWRRAPTALSGLQ
jgi:hypothetical protein